jgi:hypothetical protein
MRGATWCTHSDGSFRSTIEGVEDGGCGFGPNEGSGAAVGLGDVAFDGGLKIGRRRVSVEKKPSTALSQEAEVGVKVKVQRRWRVSQARTFGCLWLA